MIDSQMGGLLNSHSLRSGTEPPAFIAVWEHINTLHLSIWNVKSSCQGDFQVYACVMYVLLSACVPYTYHRVWSCTVRFTAYVRLRHLNLFQKLLLLLYHILQVLTSCYSHDHIWDMYKSKLSQTYHTCTTWRSVAHHGHATGNKWDSRAGGLRRMSRRAIGGSQIRSNWSD